MCLQNEHIYPFVLYELGEVCRFTMICRMYMHENSCSQEVVRKKDEQTLLTQDWNVWDKTCRGKTCVGGKTMCFAAGKVFAVRARASL